MTLNWARLPCKCKNTSVSGAQNLNEPLSGPNLTKTLLPNLKVRQQDFEGLLLGQRIHGPGPLYIGAQGLGLRRPIAEDDFTSNIPQDT